MMATTGTVRKKAEIDATERFFETLATRGREPLLKGASGTIRFDLADGGAVEHWCVAIKKGDVSVSHEKAKADAVVRVDRDLFDGIVSGRENAMAATLRGALVPEGDLGLVMSFQRLFPGPPGGGAARATGGKRTR